jgi:uncharacterized membrane protein YhaH (DUF805 family)
MNYFLNALKNKYADFNGRARRAEFWQFYLFMIIALVVLGGIGALIHFPALVGIGYLGLLVPYFAVAARRMHDVGKSGWFILIPLYNLILTFTDGDKGTNEYGPDPKGSSTDFTVPSSTTM